MTIRMRTPWASLALLASVAPLLAGTVQAGTVDVSFVQPDRYTDAGQGADAEAARKTLDQHLQALGQAGLPAQQRLKIEILDIDLAGEIRPMPNLSRDLRVLKGRADWPRIHLRYALIDGDKTLSQGDETLSDMAYLVHNPVGNRSEALPYERRMLSDWFRSHFGPAATKP